MTMSLALNMLNKIVTLRTNNKVKVEITKLNLRVLEQFVSFAQEFRITMPLYVILCVKDLQILKLQDITLS